jgi:hypothetical protein
MRSAMCEWPQPLPPADSSSSPSSYRPGGISSLGVVGAACVRARGASERVCQPRETHARATAPPQNHVH